MPAVNGSRTAADSLKQCSSPAFPQAPPGTNCYLVAPAPGEECVIIDPGIRAQKHARGGRCASTAEAGRRAAHPRSHRPHVLGRAGLRRQGRPGLDPPRRPRACSPTRAGSAQRRHAAVRAADVGPSPTTSRELTDGETICAGRPGPHRRPRPRPYPGLGDLRTPGRRPRDLDAPVLFTGDLLFAGSIGRTDLPGGATSRCCSRWPASCLPLPDETRGAARPRPADHDRPRARDQPVPAGGRAGRAAPTTRAVTGAHEHLQGPQGHVRPAAAARRRRSSRCARRWPRRAPGRLRLHRDAGLRGHRAVRPRRRRVHRRGVQGDVHLRRPRRPVGHAAPRGHRRRGARGARARPAPRRAAGQALVLGPVLPLRASAGRPLPPASSRSASRRSASTTRRWTPR